MKCIAGINGNWGSWSNWGSCIGEYRSRSRLCDNPAPKNGGSQCPGNDYDTKKCKIDSKLTSKTPSNL